MQYLILFIGPVRLLFVGRTVGYAKAASGGTHSVSTFVDGFYPLDDRLPEVARLKVRVLPAGSHEEDWPQYQYQVCDSILQRFATK